MWLVRRGKGNKQNSWKTLLATDENQDISCDRFFANPILVYSGSLTYLFHKGISDKTKSERRTLSHFSELANQNSSFPGKQKQYSYRYIGMATTR